LKQLSIDLNAQKEIPTERQKQNPVPAALMVTRSAVKIKEEPMDEDVLPLGLLEDITPASPQMNGGEFPQPGGI
jgi:hypothetical protein